MSANYAMNLIWYFYRKFTVQYEEKLSFLNFVNKKFIRVSSPAQYTVVLNALIKAKVGHQADSPVCGKKI